MKGVIWVRVSTEMQTRGYSQDYQLRECERIAKEKEIKIVKVFRIDETATRWWKRYDFKEMMKYLQKTDGYFLFIYTVDRLLRNLEDYVNEVKPLIIKNNTIIYWVEINQTIKKDSPSNIWMLFEKSVVEATGEGRKISERTRHGMEQKAREGWYPTMAPIGYLNVHSENERPKIIVDEERSPLVVKAFELYSSGKYSLLTLQNEINRRGLKTKNKKKRISRKITKHGIQSVLRNPFYTGKFRWNKIIWPGKHPRLISDELFEKVQIVLKSNNQNPKGSTKKWYPFKPFLKCGYCHSSITADEGWKNYVFYRCTKSKNPNCPQRNIRQEKIDDIFKREIGTLDSIKPEIIEWMKKKIIESSEESKSIIKKERKYLESQLTQSKNKLSLLYDDRLAEHISLELFLEKQKQLNNEILLIQDQLKRVEVNNREYRDQGITILELIKNFKEIYCSQDWEGKSKILSVILDRCSLRGDDYSLIWKPPFDIIFTMSDLIEKDTVVKKQKWGE